MVGNPLPTSSEAGANLPELMDRMGHNSTRAALIYLHSSGERLRTLADAVGDAARAALQRPSNQRKHLARMWHMTGIAASE